jgi:hypothetical protein
MTSKVDDIILKAKSEAKSLTQRAHSQCCLPRLSDPSVPHLTSTLKKNPDQFNPEE